MAIPGFRVGCAGWTLPGPLAEEFPGPGTHLQRYAARFNAVEINSSFHRPHRPQTYAKWAAAVPADFRFAVKLPKTITHGAKLRGVEELVEQFAAEVGGLGEKLGPVLVQLPPSFAFDAQVAGDFFDLMRTHFAGPLVCEPRHASWLEPDAEALLSKRKVARAGADPVKTPGAEEPGGWEGLRYFRLHGSPRIYYSAYERDFWQGIASKLKSGRKAGAEAWCIFDNTAGSAAAGNALELMTYLDAKPAATRK
jgi:uncharacterized protein YecE (DUF72 family)